MGHDTGADFYYVLAIAVGISLFCSWRAWKIIRDTQARGKVTLSPGKVTRWFVEGYALPHTDVNPGDGYPVSMHAEVHVNLATDREVVHAICRRFAIEGIEVHKISDTRGGKRVIYRLY